MTAPLDTRPASKPAWAPRPARERARHACVAALLLGAAGRRRRGRRTTRWSPRSTASKSARATSTMAEEDLGQNVPQMPTGDAKRDYLVAYLTDMILVAKAAEAKKIADQQGLQAPPRLHPQQAADGDAAAGGRQGRGDRRRPCTRSTTTRSSRWAASRRCARATSWSPTEAEAKAILAELKKGTDFAELAKQKSKDPGRRGAKAAISATSPRTRWCRNSPRSPSSSTRARCPTR